MSPVGRPARAARHTRAQELSASEWNEVPTSATVDYVFTAYDIATEFLAWEAPISEDKVAEVWAAARITLPPGAMLNCWPLEPSQARLVAHLLHREVKGDEAYYFVEAQTPATS